MIKIRKNVKIIRTIIIIILTKTTTIKTGKSVSDFDAMYVGWPSVIEVGSEYRMYYHTYNSVVVVVVIVIVVVVIDSYYC